MAYSGVFPAPRSESRRRCPPCWFIQLIEGCAGQVDWNLVRLALLLPPHDIYECSQSLLFTEWIELRNSVSVDAESTDIHHFLFQMVGR
jgi:hypothetical protein